MRILAVLALVPALLATSGCMTLGGIGDGARQVTVNTEPAGALLAIDGAGECETPCKVKLDGPRRARLAKAGFVTRIITLTPDRRSLTVPMELAAATDDVDAVALPSLD
ncbi:PEGA domain-containing protein [Hyphococcus luteus]|uniref:PEGA domain-containing protein n=1 Tax=Hyphococcus luteus TaxID=2058213 RepID=A0A2S7K2G3_9PROT|nr:PEGA domain-containing protein [Marinicaulis flavus]PQA86689.1 hypothetical protein CW354_14425 [Marinicaulis flavus]